MGDYWLLSFEKMLDHNKRKTKSHPPLNAELKFTKNLYSHFMILMDMNVFVERGNKSFICEQRNCK